MKHKNFDQYKRMLRFLIAILMIASSTFVFMEIWKDYYNVGIVFPFYSKGHWLMAVVYAFFLFIFLHIFGGLQFGYLKRQNVIFSQILGICGANVMGYIQTVLLSARFVDVIPMIAITLVDVLPVLLWTFLADLIFKKMFPPRKLPVLYEEYQPEGMLSKMKSRKDRYEIDKVLQVGDDWRELVRNIEEYDAVLIYDVHATLRNKILKYCYSKSIRVYVTPKISDILIRSSENIHLFDTPLLLSRNSGLTFEQKFIKRGIDIVLSLLVLTVTSPFMLLTAIAIKLYDGGPVFFKQDRCTIDGKVFRIHKFRSMIVDAEKEGISIPASEKDPRITPVGDFIRKPGRMSCRSFLIFWQEI